LAEGESRQLKKNKEARGSSFYKKRGTEIGVLYGSPKRRSIWCCSAERGSRDNGKSEQPHHPKGVANIKAP